MQPIANSSAAQAAKPVLDVAGVGFGPSNMALAIAFEELGLSSSGMVFFEKQRRFGWHRGMLLEDATMQVSFLKDLVTMRNPASGYSFVSYLADRGRIAEFINSKTLFPLRIEFHDYLEWVARRFEPVVRYNSDVAQIRPVTERGVVEYVDVVARGGGVVRARNVVIGSGLVPYLPPGVTESDRIWHSSRLLEKITSSYLGSPARIMVVGAGQSAAEVVCYLYNFFPEAEVCCVFSRYGYSLADDSPFVNGIFDPRAVDEFYDAPESIKKMLYGYHANTNYSAVDLSLSQELYRSFYRERVTGGKRLRIMRASSVREARDCDRRLSVRVELSLTGAVETLEADVLIYATGYRPADPTLLLGELVAECKSDGSGRLALDRDYRVPTSGAVRCGIYLNGGSAEQTHGLSAGLLSNTAVRSGEIAMSILRRL
jgi:L-ornithine N5-monooxygenase